MSKGVDLKGVIARGDRGIAGDVTVSRNMPDSDRARMAVNVAAKDDTFLVWVETPEEADAWKPDEWLRTGLWELDDMLWDQVIVITAGQLRALVWSGMNLEDLKAKMRARAKELVADYREEGLPLDPERIARSTGGGIWAGMRQDWPTARQDLLEMVREVIEESKS